jgi:hypothetical protein
MISSNEARVRKFAVRFAVVRDRNRCGFSIVSLNVPVLYNPGRAYSHPNTLAGMIQEIVED